jgi:excisionase family DNA binding protein
MAAVIRRRIPEEISTLAALMTVKDVAAYLNTPQSWVYNNMHLLPAIKLGREYRFRRSEIEAWLDEQRERPLIGRGLRRAA